jgi:hypothetical protein
MCLLLFINNGDEFLKGCILSHFICQNENREYIAQDRATIAQSV